MAIPIHELHASLYFADGNIALFAQRAPGEYSVFRVHRSMLAKLSPIFETMFGLPTNHAEEKFDGVPLVCMPDGADELESLLMVLYHEMCATVYPLFDPHNTTLTSICRTLPFKRLDPSTPQLVKQILRLSNKYGMDHFRHRIVEHLELDWPQSLDQWDKLEDEIHSIKISGHTQQSNDPRLQWTYPDDRLPEPASAIRLGRDCEVPSILPAAFYHISRLSILNDWHDVRRKLDSSSIHHELYDGCRTAKWNLLAAEDLVCLLKGRERLAMAASEMLQIVHPEEDEHWPNEYCIRRCFRVTEDIQNACRYSRDILCVTRLYMERGRLTEQTCQLCRTSIQQALSSFRHQLWARLPEIFGLT